MTLEEQIAANEENIRQTQESIASIEENWTVVRERTAAAGDPRDALPALERTLGQLQGVRARLLAKQAYLKASGG